MKSNGSTLTILTLPAHEYFIKTVKIPNHHCKVYATSL